MDSARPRDFSLTTALCLSLFVHAFLLFRAAEMYSAFTLAHLSLPGYSQEPVIAQPLLAPETTDPWRRLGNMSGTGTAIADSPGDQPQVAPEASQDQPFLSLDAAGQGAIGDEPSESLLRPGSAPVAAPELPEVQEQPGVPLPFGFDVPQGEFSLPISPRTQLAQPGGAPEQSADAGDPGAVSPPADPAPAGRLESDPTSVDGGVEFRPGATNVRLGRAAKITRPRITLGGRADQFLGAGRVIVLKIRTGTDGNVIHAEIFRSSGSSSVDLPCKLAAYNWWFEPPKDKDGKPVEDVFLFTIRFI